MTTRAQTRELALLRLTAHELLGAGAGGGPAALHPSPAAVGGVQA